MKIAILSESLADDTAIRILVEGLVGSQIECIGIPWLKTRGWPSILNVLPKVIQYIHYETDVCGLVVVADSDHSPLHCQVFEQGSLCKDKCRMCRMLNTVAETKSRLAAVPGRSPLGVAVGVAIPSIEAWYRCGLDHQVNEAVWKRALESGELPYDTRRLKRTIYGTDRPSLATVLQTAIDHSRRLVNAGELSRLEQHFPIGFGSLANDVRSWLS